VRGLSSVARLFCLHSGTVFSSTDSVLKTLVGFVIQRGILVTGSDRALGRVLYVLFICMLVCWTGKCLSIAYSMLMVIPTE